MTHNKRKCSSIIERTSQYQQSNLHHLQKTQDSFNEGYDTDGEPGPLCDVEDIEDNQDFDQDALPDIFPLDAGENASDGEGKESVLEGCDKSNNY